MSWRTHSMPQLPTGEIRRAPPFIVGVGGGSASGKTTVCRKLIEGLGMLGANKPRVVVIPMDNFYRALDPEKIALALKSQYDFDHPDAFEFPLLVEKIVQLKNRQTVEIPIYDFTTHSRKIGDSMIVHPADVIVIEGILVLHDPALREQMDLKVFVSCDNDICLARRILRDISQRGRDVLGVITQYQQFVKPSYDDFIRPSMRFADVVVPNTNTGETWSISVAAIDLLCHTLQSRLEKTAREAQTWNSPSIRRKCPHCFKMPTPHGGALEEDDDDEFAASTPTLAAEHRHQYYQQQKLAQYQHDEHQHQQHEHQHEHKHEHVKQENEKPEHEKPHKHEHVKQEHEKPEHEKPEPAQHQPHAAAEHVAAPAES